MNKSTAARLGPLMVVIFTVALAVGLAEGVLRIALSPSDFLLANLATDSVLGHRIPANGSGHDALGFRNSAVPSHADIVAIGDSLTYGVSAATSGSWPYQLGALLGERVYNMGLGGYGPLQYLYLAQHVAKPMAPRVWVIGLYFGNDLMDAYNLSHGLDYWRSWRLSERAPNSLTEFDTIGAAAVPKRRFGALREWLSHHSMLYSVLRATVFSPLALGSKEAAARATDKNMLWAWTDPGHSGVKTIFQPRPRLAAIDPTLPAVREGIRLSERALAELKAEAARQGAGLLVLITPTKERVYCSYLVKIKAALPPSYSSLCAAESKVNDELKAFLQTQSIAHVDATGPLAEAANQGVTIYPQSADGHPVAAGYSVIAQVVAAGIRRHFPHY